MEDVKVKPTEPLAAYIGGKRLLSKKIIEKINLIPHKRYCEPFMGMGGIFLRRDVRKPTEVINDINKDIVNLFRICQRHYNALLEMFEFAISSRDEFKRLRALPREYLTDIERAYCFLYLRKHAFGGKNLKSINFERSYFKRNSIQVNIKALHDRLKYAFIDCLSYEDFIKKHDKPNTLFYLDPPYYGTEHYYSDGFKKEDFIKLADILKNIQSHFILSINDCPEIRELFDDFNFEVVDIKYSCNAKTKKQSQELIISNYDFE